MSLLTLAKHLAGRHNQKRHAWRYGSTAAARRAFSGAAESFENDPFGLNARVEREIYKTRARVKAGRKKDAVNRLYELSTTGQFTSEQKSRLFTEYVDASSRNLTYGKHTFHGMSKPEAQRLTSFYGMDVVYHPSLKKQVVDTMVNVASYSIPEKLVNANVGIVFTKQHNKDDKNWERDYNIPGFVSLATGGDGVITVYNGRSLTAPKFAHESGHNYANKLYGSTHPPKTSEFGKIRDDWEQNPRTAEPPVRTYGRNSISEDYATSVEMYVDIPNFMQKTYPKRYALIDGELGNE